MQVRLLCFGIAKDILGTSQTSLELQGPSLKSLREQLCEAYPEFERLSSLRFAVDETYQEDSFELKEGSLVAIIPPVSGG